MSARDARHNTVWRFNTSVLGCIDYPDNDQVRRL